MVARRHQSLTTSWCAREALLERTVAFFAGQPDVTGIFLAALLAGQIPELHRKFAPQRSLANDMLAVDLVRRRQVV